ncbi:MAG: alpha/beta hydrolase [Reyranella sp.]|uniref:alpha/beta hydrolase n=1 Tax=Reyranella sp. TaxID=1929291 RepID=UPI003D1179C2
MSLARRGLLAGLPGALLGGCSAAAVLNATVPRKGFTLEREVTYGPLPRQTLDLYRPDRRRADGRSVLFFYGGAWDSGRKEDYLFVGQALAARGVTTIIADYRLYPEVTFPAFLEDGARATAWAAGRVGTDRLFLMGHSAGAYIALMLAADTPHLAAAGVDRLALAGAIGLSGPYDFLPLRSRRLQQIFGGADRRETQPITFATAPLPPILLIHGTADLTVKPANSERLAAAWRRAGSRADLTLYPEIDHVDVVAAFSDFLHRRAPTRADVLAWIDKA